MTEQMTAEEEADWEARRDEAAMLSAPVRLVRALDAVRHIVALTSSRINVLSADARPEFLVLTIEGRAHSLEIANYFAGDNPVRETEYGFWFDWRYGGHKFMVWIRVEPTAAEKRAALQEQIDKLETEVAS